MSQDGGHAAALLRMYPVLSRIDQTDLEPLLGVLAWHSLAAESVVFDEAQACAGFPFVIEGSIRVSKLSPNGRELTLYRVDPGMSCIITTSCLLGRRPYGARGRTTAPTVLALLPASAADLLVRLDPLREFLFGVFSERIGELMQLVEEVAFRRLDERLASLLLERGPVVAASHQELADELGSVREIVSRLLGAMAEAGLVQVERRRIEVIDAARLRRWVPPGS